jgi:DNA mismatch repair protein MutS2
LANWLADGRGDALRHLGWVRLAGLVGEGLRTEMAKSRLLDELDALEGLIEGRFRGLGAEQITERFGAKVAAACDRLPMLRPQADRDAALALLDEFDGVALLAQLDDYSDADEGPRLGAALGELEDLDESLGVARAGSLLSVVELVGVV